MTASTVTRIPNGLAPIALDLLPERPLVSVLIANYNYADFIGAAIESVLRQTYDHLKVIVYDDASTDASCEVVARYAREDPRVMLLRGDENRGQAAAVNAGWLMSQGEIICLLDSDDTYRPEKVMKVVRHFQSHPTVGFVIHRGMCVDRAGRAIQEIPYATRFESGWLAPRVIARGGRWRDMPNSALSFRREAGELVFPIPEASFRTASDGFVFTLLPLITEVSAIDEVLFDYRLHGQNDSGAVALTVDRLAKYLRFVAQQNESVNARLAELGVSDKILDVDRNLRYRQETLELLLLQGAPRSELIRRYAALAPRLLRDDLYGRAAKLLGLMVYGVALPLPVRLRSRWLNATLGYSGAKQRARRVVNALGAPTRRRAPTDEMRSA